jgi:hypothetical protein
MALLLLVDAEGESLQTEALSLDYSQYGLGLHVSGKLAPGQSVAVVPAEGSQYGVRARVVWVGPVHADSECRAGLEFLEPLSITT